jgi:hypothetical protein
MIKYIFLGVGDSVRFGEDATIPLAIPTQSLDKTSVPTAFTKSTEVPIGFTSISSIKLMYRRTGTGNLYLKFAFAYLPKAGGAPIEDVDTYTVYAGGAADLQIVPITVPTAAYSALTAMVAGDAFFLAAYRDGTSGSDTYDHAPEFNVAGFLIAYNTSEASIYNAAIDIVSLAQLKTYMGIGENTYDIMFADWITMISQLVENKLEQPVKPINTEEITNGDNSSKLYLNKGRIISLLTDPITTNTLDSLEQRDSALSDWERIVEDEDLMYLDSTNNWCVELLDDYIFPFGKRNIRVYYSAGFSPIPADIVKMVLEMLQTMWDESKSGNFPRLGLASTSSGATASNLGDSFINMDAKWKIIIDRYKRLV